MLSYNETRAIKTAKVLINARNNREAVFSTCYETPEKTLPHGMKPSSGEHASFLFLLSTAEIKVNSKTLYQNACQLYQQRPEIFDPSYVAQNFKRISRGKIESIDQGENLEIIIRDKLKHGLFRQIAERWFQNLSIVHEKYGGDVRNILKDVKDVPTAKKILGVVRPGQKKMMIVLEDLDRKQHFFIQCV